MPAEEDGEITVALQVVGSSERHDIAVRPDLPLNQLRVQLPSSIHTHSSLRFVVGNDLLPLAKEEGVTVIQVLPKLFSQDLPLNTKFTFPGVQYQRLLYQVKDIVTEVLCALVIQLSPSDLLEAQENFLFPIPSHHAAVSQEYVSALFESCAIGDEERAFDLLQRWPTSVNAVDYFFGQDSVASITPLHLAAENGHLQIVRCIIQCFSPNFVTIFDSEDHSALFRALTRRHFRVAAELLSYDSQLSVRKQYESKDIQIVLNNYPDQDLLALVKHIPPAVLKKIKTLAQRAIIAAILKNDTELVGSIIQEFASEERFINHQDEMGWTFLHHAITAGDKQIVEILIGAGADLGTLDNWGFAPLTLACQQKKSWLIPKLVKDGLSDIIISNALEQALKYGHSEAAEVLLEHVPSTCVLEKNTWKLLMCLAQSDFKSYTKVLKLTPSLDKNCELLNQFLLEAARSGDVLTLFSLLTKLEVDVNFQDYMGQTALHEASLAGHPTVVEALCQHSDVQLNMQNWRGETALHYAAKAGNIEVVELLLGTKGIDVGIRDASGRTALLAALHCNRGKILDEFLKEERCNEYINTPDSFGMTVLHYASRIPKPTLKTLVEILKAQVDTTDMEPPAPYSYRPPRNLKLLKSIYNSAADEIKITRDWEKGHIPLSVKERLAVSDKFRCECKAELCKSRVCSRYSEDHTCPPKKKTRSLQDMKKSFGNKPCRKTGKCDQPIHIAVKVGDPELVSLLVQSNNDLQLEDAIGRSPLELAIDLLLPDIVHTLLLVHKGYGVLKESTMFTPWLNRCIKARNFESDMASKRCSILEDLLKFRADAKDTPEVPPLQSELPITVATHLGLKDCVDILLQYEDKEEDRTDTILAAIKYGQADILETLLEHLVRHFGGENLTHMLGCMYDSDGFGLLGKVVQSKGEKGLKIIKSILKFCPHIVDFPLRTEVQITTHSFVCSSSSGITTINNCKGNTILELLAEQTYRSSSEKDMWEEVGCCLIENGAGNGMVEVGNGKIIHSSCAALSSSIHNDLWKMAQLLFEKGAGRQLWKCALSQHLSNCMQSIGLIIDDIIYYLCQSNVPVSVLNDFLKQGLKLEKTGEISSNTFAEAQDHRLFWVSHSRGKDMYFDDSTLKHVEMLFKVPNNSLSVKSPVERAITLAMQPVVGYKQSKNRAPKYTLPFKLKAPGKRKHKINQHIEKIESPVLSGEMHLNNQQVSTPVQRGESIENPESRGGHNTDPRAVFTRNNPPKRFMSPYSRKLARFHSLQYFSVPAMPSVFYLQPSLLTPTPQTLTPGMGPSSPVLSPSTMMGAYTYVTSVPASPAAGAVPHTPVFHMEPFTPRKLIKIFLRTPFSTKMMQSVANILRIQPSLTSDSILANWLNEWKVDTKTGIIPKSSLDEPSKKAAFVLDRTTMNLSFAATNHKISLLHEACQQGQLDVVERILHVADIEYLNNIRCKDARTRKFVVSAVGMAALGGHMEIVDALFKAGVHPVWPDVMLALETGASYGTDDQEKIVVSVLKSLQCTKVGAMEVSKAILTAAKRNYKEVMQILLEKEMEERANSKEDTIYSEEEEELIRLISYAFLEALKRNHGEVASMIFEFMAKHGHLTGADHCKFLNLAAKKGQWTLCTSILDYITDADTLLQASGEKKTLHYAAAQNQLEFVRKFVMKFDIPNKLQELKEKTRMENMNGEREEETVGNDHVINLQDSGCRTALDYALQHGHSDMIRILVIYGAVPNKHSIKLQPRSRVHKMEYERYFRSTDCPTYGGYLTEDSDQMRDSSQEPRKEKVDKDLADLLKCARLSRNLHVSILHAACCLGFLNVIKCVLQKRPQLLKQKCSGRTPLFCAVLNGHLESVELLTEMGATFDDDSYIESWLLCTCRGKLDISMPDCYSFVQEQLRAVPFVFHRAVRAHIAKQVKERYSQNAKLMFNTALTDPYTLHQEAWNDVLIRILEAHKSVGNEFEPNSRALLYLVALLGEPDVTELYVSKVPIQSDSLTIDVGKAKYWTYKIPLTPVDAILSLHSSSKAQDNIDALMKIHPDTKISPLTLMASHLRQVQNPGELVMPDDFCISTHPQRVFEKTFYKQALMYLMQNEDQKPFMQAITPVVQSEKTTWLNENKEDFLIELLHMAIQSKCPSAVKTVLTFSANPLAPRKVGKGWSGFHYACHVGSVDMLQLLQEAVSVVDSVVYDRLHKEHYDVDLAYLASARGHDHVLNWLKNIGLSLDLQNEGLVNEDSMKGVLTDPNSCLRTALLNGQKKTIDWLMECRGQYGYENDALDNVKTSLYHYAACLKDQKYGVSLIKRLHQLGVQGFHLQDENGFTPLDCAQMMGNLDILDCLLGLEGSSYSNMIGSAEFCSRPQGALRHRILNENSTSQDKDLSSSNLIRRKKLKKSAVLFSYLSVGDDDMAFWIIKSKLLYLIKNQNESKEGPAKGKGLVEKIMIFACASGCTKSVKLMLDIIKGLGLESNVNLFDALATAIAKGCMDCAQALLEKKFIDPLQVSSMGENVLHIAVKTCSPHSLETVVGWMDGEMVKKKLLHMEDNKGLTPFHIAKSLHGMWDTLAKLVGEEQTAPVVKNILQIFQECPSATNKASVMNEIRAGKPKFLEDICALTTSGSIPASVLSIEELLHWIVSVLPQQSLRTFLETLHGSQNINCIGRWGDLTLGETAFMLGKVEVALWLEREIGGQFRVGEGLMWSVLTEMKGHPPQELYSLLQTAGTADLIHNAGAAVSFQVQAKNAITPPNINPDCGVQEEGPTAVDEIRKRVTERTLPKLRSLLKKKLNIVDVTIEVDWESFGLNSHGQCEPQEDVSSIDIFHHSEKYGVPFAGLGPLIDECSMYMWTIKKHLGVQALNNFPSVDLEHLTIQRSSPVNTASSETRVVWQFDYKHGKVIYNPQNLPFWRPLRLAYQASLEWSHSLHQICRRHNDKSQLVQVSIDWDSIYLVFPCGNMPQLVRNAIASELVRLASVANSQVHFHKSFSAVQLSITEMDGAISRLHESGLSIQLKISDTDNGWKIHELDCECFFENEIIQDFLKKRDVTWVSGVIHSINLQTLTGGRIVSTTVPAVFDLDAEGLQKLVSLTLREMAGPACIQTVMKRLKKALEKDAFAEFKNDLLRINTGLYHTPKYLKHREDKNQGKGDVLRIIDPLLEETINTKFPGEMHFTVQNRALQVNAPDSVFELCLGEILKKGVLFSFKAKSLQLETEWSKANRDCYDIPQLILEDMGVEKTCLFINLYLKKLFPLLPSLNEDEMVVLQDQLEVEVSKQEAFWRDRSFRELKKVLEICIEVKKLYMSQGDQYPSYDTSVVQDNMKKIWNEILRKSLDTSRRDYRKVSCKIREALSKLIKEIGCGSGGKDVVCPSECTLSTTSLHTACFPLSEPSTLSQGNKRRIYIELRGMNGQILKDVEAIPDIKLDLFNSRTSLKISIPVLKCRLCAEPNGVEVEYDLGGVRQILKDEKSGYGWSMIIHLNECHINQSPFHIITKPSFLMKPILKENQPGMRLTAPVESIVSVMLLHDIDACSRSKNSCQDQILPRSKPSEYLTRNKLRSEMSEAGYMHVWTLGNIHCYSNSRLICQVESLQPGLFHVQVKAMKSGESNVMKAFCGKCSKYLEFAVEGGLTENLKFAATAGKPDVTKSVVLDAHDQGVPPSTKPTWTIVAGEHLQFLFLPMDNKLNTFNAIIDTVPEFSFVSSTNNSTVSPISANFLHNKSVLSIKTEAMCQCGVYALHMDGKVAGEKDAVYSVKVQPGDVSHAMCTVSGEGLSVVPTGYLVKFTVVLRDAYENIVDAKGIGDKSGLQVGFSPEKARAHIRYDNGNYVCSYRIDEDFHSEMLMSVTYKGKHLPGSPFSVKWTANKSFSQRHQELRKNLERMRKKNGKVELFVRRSQVVEDTFQVISRTDPSLLHYPVQVEFMDEKGYDAGGLTRELYQLLSQAIFDPNFALFEKMEDGRYRPYYNSSVQEDHLQYFNFIGKIFAKAIFDGVGLDVHMVESFYKNILGIPTDFSDLVSEDKILYRSLSQLSTMESEEDVEALCLTFAIDESKFGSTSSYILKPGGEEIDVSLSNRLEYIQLYTNYVCNVRVQDQLENFKAGFSSVIPLKLLSELNHKELEFIMCGHSRVEISRLRALTTYEGGYTTLSKPVVWFWSLFESWSQKMRKKFLQFLTGNTRIPAATKDWRIYIQQCPSSDKLPTASTCFNILRLPAYKTAKELRSMMTKAVTLGSEGFGNT